MKIHQLPMGARFVFEGVEYVKSGPMVATGAGGQRLIPKYAILTPVAGSEPVPAATPSLAVRREETLRAFEDFYETCLALVPADQAAALEVAREGFLKSLG